MAAVVLAAVFSDPPVLFALVFALVATSARPAGARPWLWWLLCVPYHAAGWTVGAAAAVYGLSVHARRTDGAGRA